MAEPNKVRGNRSRDVESIIGVSEKFKLWNRLIMRDLNQYTNAPTFSLFTKDDIAKYLSNPYKYEKQLRKAVQYIYNASSHFRRLIQYFVGLTNWAYLIMPYNLDTSKANVRITNNNYRKVMKLVSSMSIETQFPKILTVCMREDIFYGTVWITADNFTIQQLPSDYCAISSVEGNVPNVTFDFSYFDSHISELMYYPEEFRRKYDQYKKQRSSRWIELDAPYSFAIKVNNDILAYAIPPFAGILRELFDLEDYKGLKLAKTALENYAMLAMKIPMEDDGSWGIDLDKARDFWRNLDAVLPDEIGSILTPMDIDKISFEKSNTGDTTTLADAQQNIFTAAGVSSLLFNNEKASANALLLSIKADQAITYGVVKSIQDAMNRIIQDQSYGKNFMLNILDVSRFNQKEMGDAYLKAASYGLPTISAYAASQGIRQAELDGMSFLETDVLKLQDMFKPIVNSTQVSADDLEGKGATDEGGAPRKEVGEISESGEQNQEGA